MSTVFDPTKAPATGLPISPAENNAKQESASKLLASFRDQLKKGVKKFDSTTLGSVVDAIQHSNAIDDRKLLLEHILTIMSRLPSGEFENKLQNITVELLYNDLAHPPATFIGNDYAYRAADGSNNNICVPDLGKAGTPYARSVQQAHPLPADTMPDPGLVFDTLLKRERFVKHPAGLSSLFFCFAPLVIHSIFRTSQRNVNINETSSYLDLAPLYGNNQETQDRLRIKDGRGLLKPDVFAEDRLLLLPPGVCVLLVLFSRNHNFIAKKILEINERGNYVQIPLSQEDPQNQKLSAQDEEIFQIARLCNCAWFTSIIFSDYFSGILGLVRDGNSWTLNPLEEIRNLDHSFFERGQGNVCSVEFNCLYRWHATTSQAEEQWIRQLFEQFFPGKDPTTITPQDFGTVAAKLQSLDADVSHWTFGNIERQEGGAFKDTELASILQNATAEPAATFGARGTPSVMRVHEMMGIQQNRAWGVCSINDFRRFLGLKAYGSFKEWNPNPEIYKPAERLYGNIERLELYVGLQAEEIKPVVEGAGLCPGYTISRSILSDAVALVRGDRFYSPDYTPYNMTAWGFADCQRDPSAFGFGSMLSRLLLRTLPNEYTKNSVYAFFPLMTPDAMETYLAKLKVINQYDFKRPDVLSPAITITNYASISQILNNTASFAKPYAALAAEVIKGRGFFTASSDGAKEQREVLAALIDTPASSDSIAEFFAKKVQELITEYSYSQVGGTTYGLDIVRDVVKLAPVYWAATEIAGIKLKTPEDPHGAYTPEGLYDILGQIYSFIFLETEPAKYMYIQGQVRGHISLLLRHIKEGLGASGNPRFSIAGVFEYFSKLFSKPEKNNRAEIVERLRGISDTTDHLANIILAILVGSAVELSLALTNAINLYLGSGQPTELSSVASLPQTQIDGFVWEALRLDPPFEGVYRKAEKTISVGNLSLKEGDTVFLDIAGTSQDDQIFPKAQTINPNRPQGKYLVGDGTTICLGEKMTCKILGQVLRVVFTLKNIRRAPGKSGNLTRFKDDSMSILRYSYLDSNQFISAWPTSLVIQYDS